MKTGKVKITCRICDTKKKKTCTVTVKKKAKKKYIKPTKIKLDDKRMDVDVNDTVDIDYKVYPKKATNIK